MAQPITSFARLFRSYGVALGIILGAAPIATTHLRLIPMYEPLRPVLTYFTTIVSLLAVAILFASRRQIGVAVFPPGSRVLSSRQAHKRTFWEIGVPVALAVFSIASLALYLATLDHSVRRVALDYAVVSTSPVTLPPVSLRQALRKTSDDVRAQMFAEAGPDYVVTGSEPQSNLFEIRFESEMAIDAILKRTPSTNIPLSWVMKCFYITMFLSAAMAFVWFGLIEYVQQELGITDEDLLARPYRVAATREFGIPELRDASGRAIPVTFVVEYNFDGDRAVTVAAPNGPFCQLHGIRVQWRGQADGADSHRWVCIDGEGSKAEIKETFLLDLDPIALQRLVDAAAAKELRDLEAARQGGRVMP